MMKEKLIEKLEKVYADQYSIHTPEHSSQIFLIPKGTKLILNNSSEITMKAEIILGIHEKESRINVMRCYDNDPALVWEKLLC